MENKTMFTIRILEKPITILELKKAASEGFGDLIKAVVDVEKSTMAVGGELHVDMEILLIEERGALRSDTWGFNLYPEKSGDEFIEFDSMINLKPASGNRTRNVEDKTIQENIKGIVSKYIAK